MPKNSVRESRRQRLQRQLARAKATALTGNVEAQKRVERLEKALATLPAEA